MVTKKKTKKKTKKAASKKTASTRSKRPKKAKVPYEPNEGRIVYFMNSLIQAGYVGKTVPKESKGKRQASQELRQMAQQLDRQVHKTVS